MQLSHNRISKLPRDTSNLTVLTELDLSRNAFKAVPDQLYSLPTLRTLLFSHASPLVQRMPSELNRCTLLERLHLQGIGLAVLPAKIADLRHLTWLCLRENQLQLLPVELFSLTTLTDLDVASNKLSVLPDAVGQLARLKHLSLRQNSLTEVPAVLGSLPLETLEVSENIQLRSPPAVVVSRGLSAMLRYLQDMQLYGAEEIRHFNVVFAGPLGSGKSALATALQEKEKTQVGKLAGEWIIDLASERGDGRREQRSATCSVVELPHNDPALLPVEQFSPDRTIFVLVFSALWAQVESAHVRICNSPVPYIVCLAYIHHLSCTPNLFCFPVGLARGAAHAALRCRHPDRCDTRRSAYCRVRERSTEPLWEGDVAEREHGGAAFGVLYDRPECVSGVGRH